MRIAFLAVKSPFRGGGIEKYTFELGSRFVQRGHEVTVYSMKHYGETPNSVAGMKVIPLFSFKKPCLQKISASLSASLHTVCRSPYDIVHLHSVASGAFGFLPRLWRMKTVLQMHGIEWQRSRWGAKGSTVLRFLEKSSVRQATAITAVSQSQCRYLRNRYGCEVAYIPPATQLERRISAQRIRELGLSRDGYILFASRLVSEKGAHFLVKAYRRIRTKMNLVIAGSSDGNEIYTNELLALAKGDSRILFIGHVEGLLLKELFSNAYLYVQPSTIEGLSISLLEAMSYGRCCLVSDIPENLEPLDGSGFCFRSQDADDLAAKLQWLLEAPQRVQNVGVRAVERVRTEYSWDVVTSRMEAFYERVLAGALSARGETLLKTPKFVPSKLTTRGEANPIVSMVRFRHALDRLKAKRSVMHLTREERHVFKELQSRFRQVENQEQLWQTLCDAAKRMEFAWVALRTTYADGRVDDEIWRPPNSKQSGSRIVRLIIPVANGESGISRELEIALRQNDSLEATSRRAAILGRLVDENQFATTHENRRRNV